MKKLRQSKTSRLRTAEARAQRRAYQVNATRRTGVHAAPEKATKPTLRSKGKRRRKSADQSGGPYKLSQALIENFVASILEAPGSPVEFHCMSLGIDKSTYYDWRQSAREQPESIYAWFVDRVDRAFGQAAKKLYIKAVHHKPAEVLFRRYPDLFPSEHRLEVTGAGGGSLIPTAENPYAVIIELRQGGDAPPLEKPFEVEHVGGEHDGERWTWAGDSRAPWKRGNGQ